MIEGAEKNQVFLITLESGIEVAPWINIAPISKNFSFSEF
jgi:hypothetical protein